MKANDNRLSEGTAQITLDSTRNFRRNFSQEEAGGQCDYIYVRRLNGIVLRLLRFCWPHMLQTCTYADRVNEEQGRGGGRDCRLTANRENVTQVMIWIFLIIP